MKSEDFYNLVNQAFWRLLESKGRGTSSGLARHLGISDSAVSAWRRREHVAKDKIGEALEFLGVQDPGAFMAAATSGNLGRYIGESIPEGDDDVREVLELLENDPERPGFSSR